MESQQINPIEPTPPVSIGVGRFRPWLITGIVIVATGLVVGGGVYGVMSKRLASERATLEHRITDLQNQVTQLKEEKFSNAIQPESIPERNLVAAPFSSDDWLIYENVKYGITFKYPKGWYKNSESEASAFFTKLKQLPSGDTEVWAYGDQISFTVEDQALPVNDWIIKNTSGIDGYGKKIEREWITLNDIKVLRIKESALGTSDDIVTNYIFKDDKVIILYLYPYLSNDSTIDQILSTFKFLNTAPVSTVDWKIYKGERYQFKYPSGWSIKKQGETIQLNTKATAGIMNAYTERITKNPQTELLDWLAVELGVKRGQMDKALDMINVNPTGGKGFRVRSDGGYGSGYITYLMHNSEMAAIYKIECIFRDKEDVCLGFSNSFEFID